MKNLKTILLSFLILIIGNINISAQTMKACRGINDSIEIHGGVGPYTWYVDSIYYQYYGAGTWFNGYCGLALQNLNNSYYWNFEIIDTTQVIFYIGNNTTIKPNKIYTLATRGNIPLDDGNIGDTIVICSNPNIQINNIYPIRIYDSNGDSLIINSADELQNPTANITSINESSSQFCNGSINATLSIGATPIWLNSNTDTISTNDTISNLCAGIYTLNLIDTLGCKNSYTTTINAGPIPNTQPICLITVDQSNTHNLIVWDKTLLDTNVVDSIIIYRETSTNVYTKTGTVSIDSLSKYDDYLANPNTTGYRYKLAVKSYSGVVSPMSVYHNTIYLTNNNANFSWTPYQIENQTGVVANYNLYRDNDSDGNFLMIAQTTGQQLGVTDIDFSLYPNASYYVEAVMTSGSCDVTRAYTGSRSNIKSFSTVGIKENILSNVSIYPNPATNVVNITGITRTTTIKVHDVLGNVVMETTLRQDASIDISILSKGVYTFSLSAENGAAVNKMIVKQ